MTRVTDICQKHEINKSTYYQWKCKYDKLKTLY
ncbi:transposase [Advenella sp. RU8]